YSVNVPVNQLRSLAETPGVQYVSAGHVVTPDLNTSLVETRANVVHRPPAGVPLTGAGGIVGGIDSGCGYTLDDFRQFPGGPTRLVSLWDQTLTPTGSEGHPRGFNLGVEYTEADINATLLPTSGQPIKPIRHEFTVSEHGTHVMGIAAGNGLSGD